MVPGGRGPGGGDPLAHHPICVGHWPNVRSHTLARRPDARRLICCTAPRGSERAAHWNDLREDRWRPLAPRKGGGERVVPGGRGPGDGDPLAHHPICAGHWPNVRSRPLTRRPTACPATGKHQGTNFTTPRRQRVRAPGVVGRGGRSVAPRQAAASARPTSAKFDGDQSHRASEATSTWSPEGVARAAATPRAPPHLCGPLA